MIGLQTGQGSDGAELCVTQYGAGLTDKMMQTLHVATSSEHMIPLTPEGLRQHSLGVTAVCGSELAGYTGITSEYTLTDADGNIHRALEVGGAVVLPAYRGRGLASAMLRRIIEHVRSDSGYPEGTRLVAFTNPGSRGYMERGGLVMLGPGEKLSAEAFQLCKDCTRCPNSGPMPWENPAACCDADGIRAIIL